MIQLKNVYKAFGPKRVLDGFTLDVPEGETMVIIGYSGTGKSVAIKHIVGLLEPDDGEVWVDGLNVPELSRRELYALRSRIGWRSSIMPRRCSFARSRSTMQSRLRSPSSSIPSV